MNALFIVGLTVATACVASGLTIAALGPPVPGLALAGGGALAGFVLAWFGSRPDAGASGAVQPPARAGQGGEPRVLPSSPPGAVPRADDLVSSGDSPRIKGPLAEARTPIPSGTGERRTPRLDRRPGSVETVEMDLEVGEGTMTHSFVPDYSAQAIPGLQEIYRYIQSGQINGYLLVVDGPDRGAGTAIKAEPITIGRATGNSLQLSDHGVSSEQATVVWQGGRVYLTDNKSKNGTYVNNQRVQMVELSSCDVLAFGATKILVTLA